MALTTVQDDRTFQHYTEAGLDVNSTATTSTAIDVDQARWVSFQGVAASGTFASAVVTAQVSCDGTNYVDATLSDDTTSAATTGAGLVHRIPVAAKWFRVKVTTAEGGAGTGDFDFQVKH